MPNTQSTTPANNKPRSKYIKHGTNNNELRNYQPTQELDKYPLPDIYLEAFKELDQVHKLRPQHQLFVRLFLATNNASKAGKLAGFKAYDYGRQLIQKRYIIDALVAIKNYELTTFDVTPDAIVERLTLAYERAILHSDRASEIRALELLGKHAGVFEKDNKQRSGQVYVQMNFEAAKPTAAQDTRVIDVD